MYETVAEDYVQGNSGKQWQPFNFTGGEKTASSTGSQAFVSSSLRCAPNLYTKKKNRSYFSQNTFYIHCEDQAVNAAYTYIECSVRAAGNTKILLEREGKTEFLIGIIRSV